MKKPYKPNEVVAGMFDGVEKKVSELTVAELRSTLCKAFELLDKIADADLSSISDTYKEIHNWMTL